MQSDSSDHKQSQRVARLDTPFGPDELVLYRFEGHEGLSELFEYRVEALSRNDNINFDRAIGKNCSVTIDSYNNVKRVFCGVLVEAQWTGIEGVFYAYSLVLRPWLWLLSRRADCRIFQDETVVDIIEKVFTTAGFADYALRVSRSEYPEIPYCVQYRETDLAFVSRLMEEWGIYTFFQHETARHTLIVADSRSSHVAVSLPAGTVPFIALTGQNRREQEHIYHWRSDRQFRTGKMSTNDFDYMKPTTNLKADSQSSESYEWAKLEAFDYPGRYTEEDVGKRRTKVRLEAEQAVDRRRHAAGDAVSLYPGALFNLKQHTEDGQYLVVRASHRYTVQEYRSGGTGPEDEIYFGRYELLKSDRPFRAMLSTPKPLVHGPQTGLVVARKGKESEEIDVDEEGRIFVQFHWNRDKEKISRPVRVAQMWSGKGWGGQFIPRVGQEVVIEFLEGDPDQPLVVGTVYNKDYRYPFELPDNKTISGLKSDSTKGHGGYNEFVFDDLKGKEKIKLRAEKDHESIVRNSETRVIGETFTPPMGSPSRETTLKNGDEKLVVESGNWDVDVAQKIHIQAKLQVVIEVGGSKIEMNPGMITLTAPLIKIN
jgi:type VI secretion system secreted protein VgrG